MRWLPTPSFLLNALRFSPPSALRRPSSILVQQQGLLALGRVRPFSLLHHHHQQHSASKLGRILPLRLRAHSTAASTTTTTMATREEKDRYACFRKKRGRDGRLYHLLPVLIAFSKTELKEEWEYGRA